ncbi:MAG: SIS domain-containing protein, partial [Clostridia bacterium]|nr:SIS domain-containing protein [Clostridia bacterium]
AAGGKLLVCGNGGSAADCEHIVGELMKGFHKKRELPADSPVPADIAAGLQGALPAISLVSQSGLCTAFINDCDPELVFAQQVYGYLKPGDVLLGLSTSGNSANVAAAARTASALGGKTLAVTGESGGRLALLCDVCVRLPACDTAQIQELTLPVYHALCALLEDAFFAS